MKETRIVMSNLKEKYIDGYFLTIEQLVKLCRDFQADCFDGFVSNDNAYIELWLKKLENE